MASQHIGGGYLPYPALSGGVQVIDPRKRELYYGASLSKA